MNLQGKVRNGKLLIETIHESITNRKTEGLKFLAGVNIRIAKGLINDSEMKSFLSSIERSLAAFDPESPCQIEIEASVISPDQVEIETEVHEKMERARSLEASLTPGAEKVRTLGGS